MRGLNPYYTGSTTLGSQHHFPSDVIVTSLNPYYTGSTTLGTLSMPLYQLQGHGLNPYYTGSTTLGPMKTNNIFTARIIVLILIILEVPLWEV